MDKSVKKSQSFLFLCRLSLTRLITFQVEWARKTHDWMESMWKSPEAGNLGVCLIPAIRLNHEPLPPFWRDVVFGYREMSKDEVKTFGRLTGEHQTGTEFLTFTAEPAK